MFTDDIISIKCEQKATLSIDSDIRHLSRWFVDNKLTLIVEKSETVIFGSKQPQEVFLISKALTNHKSCKYLGIQLDSGLRFRKRIDFILKKLNKFCGLIYWVQQMWPRKCCLVFYNSFEIWEFLWSEGIWNSCENKFLKKSKLVWVKF